jgi:tRNA (guanine37-N1)-methyltransferase
MPWLLKLPALTVPCTTKVPDVLLSGNHLAIKQWQKEESLKRTKKFRPDLLK